MLLVVGSRQQDLPPRDPPDRRPVQPLEAGVDVPADDLLQRCDEPLFAELAEVLAASRRHPEPRKPDVLADNLGLLLGVVLLEALLGVEGLLVGLVAVVVGDYADALAEERVGDVGVPDVLELPGVGRFMG